MEKNKIDLFNGVISKNMRIERVKEISIFYNLDLEEYKNKLRNLGVIIKY